MRIMIDTNLLVSAFVLSSSYLLKLIDVISEHHKIVLSTYGIDELKRVTRQKFPAKYDFLESFLQGLPFELVYTPEKIDKSKYPLIRDIKDLPILVSAMTDDVDILLTNDLDFAALEIDKPEILKPKEFLDKYY